MRDAVFLDRDGTLIESVHYLRRPEDVRLLPGVARALRRITELGYVCVVVTNQAAVARGLLTVSELERIHTTLDVLLTAGGASILAYYHAPIVQTGSNRERVEHQDRKPGPGMLLRAAREHRIALARSWMVGDSITDTLAGRNAGCRGTALVRSGLGRSSDEGHPSVDRVIDSVAELPAILERARVHETS